MFSLLSATDEGLNMHVKGLPKWMSVKNIDHLSAKEKSRILHHADQDMHTAKQQCLKNKALGARCIFGEPKE